MLLMKDVEDALISSSRVLPKGHPFLHLEGRSKEISVVGNLLSDPQSQIELGEGVSKDAILWGGKGLD
jgi:hypothetical protein